MSVWAESSIAFDFSGAVSVAAHDKPPPGQGNTTWPGVDFCIEEPDEWIWLEIKNWNPAHIAPVRRGGSRWSFICKMRSAIYTKEMRNTFLGTTAFLAWRGIFVPAPVRFILFFQPPHPLDAALLVTMQTRMKSQIPNRAIWAQPIQVSVLDQAEWNSRFRHCPARLV